MNELVKPSAPALPTSVDKFLALRKLKAKRTLNDQIEDVHLHLIEVDGYVSYLNAVYDEQAVEGSLSADNVMAAMMLREKAVEMGNSELGKEKLASISKALGVVLRRYGLSRKERRNMVDGEVVPGDNGD